MPKWIFRLPIGVSCKAHGVVWRGARRNAREWQKAVWQFCCAIRIIAGVWQGFRLPLGRYVALLVVWMIFCGIFALAQIFLGLGVTCFVSFR